MSRGNVPRFKTISGFNFDINKSWDDLNPLWRMKSRGDHIDYCNIPDIQSKSIEELFSLLSESSRMERISQADKDAVLIAIFKKQQETIEQQKELIETLWAWAEEKDDEEKTPSEADAEAYLNIMYPVEDEQKDDNLAPVKYWGEQPLLDDSVLSSITDHEFDIDYRNFKLYDEYEGEKQGYTYLNEGPQGPGYYGLKLPLQWTPNIY